MFYDWKYTIFHNLQKIWYVTEKIGDFLEYKLVLQF